MQQVADVLVRPGVRRAVANFGWLFADRVVRLVLGVGVGLLVARHLGPAQLGALSYALAFTTLASGVVSLGLEAIVKRDLLRLPEHTAEILASAAILRFVAGVFVMLVVLLVAWAGVGGEPELIAIFAVTLLQPAFLLPEVWLQAHLRAKRALTAQLSALVAASAARLWLIAADGGLAAFAWVIVAEMALGLAGLFLAARRAGLRMPLGAARGATMRRLLGESWPLMFAGLAVVVYMKIDEVMLRYLVGPTAVGHYAAAARLSEVWYFLPMALASSVLPALVRAKQGNAAEYAMRQQQYYDFSAAAAYALSVPIALLAPWVVRVAYGAEFAAAGPILAVHIWSSIFVFLGVARGQWLVNEGLQRFYLAATCAGAVANVALNFIFIPRWGGLGAAWATVVSYGLAAWLSSYFHPAVRATAAMQTRALLIPLRGWFYLRRA